MRAPDLGPEFAKLTRVIREKRFKRGVTEIQEVTVDGRLRFQVDVGSRLGADVYFGSYRELLDIEAFARVIEPADTMIEVGANFGFVSITVADCTSAKARITI